MAGSANPALSAAMGAIGAASAALLDEALGACAGSPALAQALVEGMLPYGQAFGPDRWLSESLAALGDLKPLVERAAAAAATAAASPAPAAGASATPARLRDFARLAACARLSSSYAEARGRIAPVEAGLVSPYDGSRIAFAELEAGLALQLGSGTEGPGRHARSLVRYATALLDSRGLAFAAQALAVDARPLEPAEQWFATAFRELALFLSLRKGVDIAFAASIVRDAYPKNGFGYREAALVLADFLADERYSSQAIEPLLSFIRSCALLLHPDRTEAFAKVLRLAKDFVRLSRSTDERYFGIILKAYLEHPYLSLGEWVGEGARVVRVSGGDSKEARAYFDRSSEASRKAWDAVDVGIPFEKAAPRLRPFVAALSGKAVSLAKSPGGDGSKLFMTDGETIYVPPYAMYARDRELNYLMLRHGAAHECAHIEFYSFSHDEDRFRTAASRLERLFPGSRERNEGIARAFRAQVQRKLEKLGYGVKPKPLARDEDFAPLTRLYFRTDFPMLYRDLFNIVEDRRVNALLYARYPGYAAERSRVDDIDFGEQPDLAELPESSRFIQAFLERLLLGRVKGQLPEDDATAVDALVAAAEADDPLYSDVFDSCMAAAEVLKLVLAHLASRYPKSLAKMRLTPNRLELTLRWLDAGTRLGERNGPLDFELELARLESGEEGSPEGLVRAKGAAAFRDALGDYGQMRAPEGLEGRPLFAYPEWDLAKLAYKKDACLLAELPAGDLADSVEGAILRARESHSAEPVRRAFASMKENLDLLERGADDGEDIDFDRAVDCFMDFASGGRVDMDFYLRRSRKARDLLCALVLDMSPSTSAPVEGRAIFEHERSAAYLMAEAMAAIGDAFGIFTYYDFGARASLFHVVKDFDSPYGGTTVDALAAIEPARRGFSRMAPGLRHIIAKMGEREARAKIVFLVTDGQPIYLDEIKDEGKKSKTYYVDGREVESPVEVAVRSLTMESDAYAYADLGKVAEEARLAGIRLFCVTLDGESVGPLSKVFGDSLIYLDRVSSLPSRIVEIFKRLTR